MSKASREHIDFAIAALFRPGDVVELRIPKAGRLRTISGYFDDFGKLADAIEMHSGKFRGHLLHAQSCQCRAVGPGEQ